MKMNSEQFSLRCAPSFACFLPALSLKCVYGFPYSSVLRCRPRLTVKPGGAVRFPRPAHLASSRYQRGAQGSAQPFSVDNRHARAHAPTYTPPRTPSYTASTSSCPENGLFGRNSTDSQLFSTRSTYIIPQPVSRKLDQRCPPVGLTVRAAVCVCV